MGLQGLSNRTEASQEIARRASLPQAPRAENKHVKYVKIRPIHNHQIVRQTSASFWSSHLCLSRRQQGGARIPSSVKPRGLQRAKSERQLNHRCRASISQIWSYFGISLLIGMVGGCFLQLQLPATQPRVNRVEDVLVVRHEGRVTGVPRSCGNNYQCFSSIRCASCLRQ